MAKELAPAAMEAASISDYELIGSVTGKDLEYIVCQHPFLDRDSLVIVGDHVTLDSGTGCVHTAPGHGVEDFEVCVNHYPEISIVVPVDNEGRLTKEAGEFAGLRPMMQISTAKQTGRNRKHVCGSEDCPSVSTLLEM